MKKAMISYKAVAIEVSHEQMREILAAYKSKFSRHQDELDRLDSSLIDGITRIVRDMDSDRNAENKGAT